MDQVAAAKARAATLFNKDTEEWLQSSVLAMALRVAPLTKIYRAKILAQRAVVAHCNRNRNNF